MIEENINENELDNNDDMVLQETENSDKPVSFAVNEAPYPERSWTKKQKRNVWIIAAVITVVIAAVSILMKLLGIPFFI